MYTRYLVLVLVLVLPGLRFRGLSASPHVLQAKRSAPSEPVAFSADEESEHRS